MHTLRKLAILSLAATAALGVGASAQQPNSQAAPPANAQMGSCPMAQGQHTPGMGPGQMPGRMGTMPPEAMQDMHQMRTEMAALREEMRQLREELSRNR